MTIYRWCFVYFSAIYKYFFNNAGRIILPCGYLSVIQRNCFNTNFIFYPGLLPVYKYLNDTYNFNL